MTNFKTWKSYKAYINRKATAFENRNNDWDRTDLVHHIIDLEIALERKQKVINQLTGG